MQCDSKHLLHYIKHDCLLQLLNGHALELTIRAIIVPFCTAIVPFWRARHCPLLRSLGNSYAPFAALAPRQGPGGPSLACRASPESRSPLAGLRPDNAASTAGPNRWPAPLATGIWPHLQILAGHPGGLYNPGGHSSLAPEPAGFRNRFLGLKTGCQRSWPSDRLEGWPSAGVDSRGRDSMLKLTFRSQLAIESDSRSRLAIESDASTNAARAVCMHHHHSNRPCLHPRIGPEAQVY